MMGLVILKSIHFTSNVTMKQLSVFACVVCLIMLVSCTGGSTRSTEVNVLCSVEEPWCKGMAEQFTAKFGVKVNYVRMSTGEALTRLRNEKNNPQFDVWWGGPIDSYIVAKHDGLLEAYNSPNYGNLRDPAKFKDPDNFWGGIYVGTIGFATNKNWLAQHPDVKPPESWDDLLKPEFKGQVMMAHPSTSGTAYTVLATMLQLKGEQAGWQYLSKLSDQIQQFTKSGTTPLAVVIKEVAAVSISFSHNIIFSRNEEKAPIVLTFPQDGTGYEIGGVAIVKGAKHADVAKMWLDWFMTPEGQLLAFKYEQFSAPTVKGADPLYPELLQAKLIDYDFVWAAEHKDEFVKKFTQEIATADNLLK